ncbi:two-component system response regulator [Devosia sp. Root413D1]|jgi:two-component system phosphate regulon response regulator PhoB|uniref:Phosphate regulon transcriptional regulatory protein PhoB n=1 Tax=Devosia insulae DS-56 TaxID=1116389 RepID=A0A1E5XWH5_9HYPH|nr:MULTISPECIES: phosphate regulon transcriptional regulator PhoB [Devosia]ODS82671.1 MAG: phosphate regulon transcriptional regulatory protein PhoB [Devosia sp. SCN 66-27]RYE44949.1 MAG: phosphate regulon transcriptional regulatory protein PhoB [Hyphomicrobiales bacterium]KQU93036.1 two-component system response regulator [Devosia sp. Root105]KQW75823.1 two-component system response regulator [Devosia sp. Root413D1]MBN9360969.1 phosphate regulon transcriptional regulator PhoB [Devosia sp.]
MSATILIVEDEADLAVLLRYNLEAEGFRVATAASGDEAVERIRDGVPDLILLDWMLPGLSGIELCRRWRSREETARTPIIMITARGEEEERVRGLATGADDYVVKPFSIPELLARINALLRRSSPQLVTAVLKAGDLELDRTSHRVRRGGREVHLGPTEYRLLEYLMRHPGRVYSREQLLDGVWGNDVYVDERTVDVHVGRLRKAINRHRDADPIRTVRGAGYAFDERFAAVS